jgi:Rieske 2Fe-2S family protein
MGEQAHAPIDRLAAQRVLAPFGQSRTFPAEAYRSAELLGWEERHFFERSWVCLGRTVDLFADGELRAVEIGAEGLLLTRDHHGAVRAFSNVCRHRGHELLPCGESASARVIRCPYHAWVYNLDGSLRTAPSFREVKGFDRAEYPLIEARVEDWHGWLFVNASGDAGALAEHVGNLDELVAPYEPERLRVGGRHEYEIGANWKLIAENYHECYHCTSIHPELCKVTPHESGMDYVPDGAWAGGNMELMDHAETMSLSGASLGVPLRGLEGSVKREVLYLHLFPNLLISGHPDYVMTHRLVPLTAERTFVECTWLFPPEAFDRDGFEPAYAVEFWDITNREDWGACEAVQRGAGNRGFRQGPLSPRETTLYQFVTMVAAGYLDGRVHVPAVPESDRVMHETGS